MIEDSQAAGHRVALFQEPAGLAGIRCHLCRHHCLIADGQRGLCGVRENRAGVLYSLVYGRAAALNVDPIEKKPFFHIDPGSKSFSLATVGCNFRCQHCQNHQISQWPLSRSEILGEKLSPEELVAKALSSGCRSIAYTYTEPTIYFEYAFDTARLAHNAGLKNLFVSNGYISCAALETIAPYLDGANIDIKGFDPGFYRRIAGADLEEVLACVRDYRRLGLWLEITTLIIPGQNDRPEELQSIATFIARELGIEMPWHVTGFFPNYKMNQIPPVSLNVLQQARKIGFQAGLQYVYTGNRADPDGESTRCPSCRKIVVQRRGFELVKNYLRKGSCPWCDLVVAGLF